MTGIKKGFLRSLGLILFLTAIVVLAGFIDVSAQANDDPFDLLLEQLREELFAPRIRPLTNPHQIFFDDSDTPHTPPIEEIPLLDATARGGTITPIPFGGFVEGQTRIFRQGNNIPANTTGTLTRQGTRVNVWTMDSPIATEITPAIVAHLDYIINRMEQSFAPFAGQVVVTPFFNQPHVGDIHNDGRINVLIHTHTTGGFFNTGDYFNDNGHEPLPLFHVGARNANGESRIGTPGFFGTFAHEFQHLLFHLHFNVYLPIGTPAPAVITQQFLWFNESLSELASFLYAHPGSQTISETRLWRASENSYANASINEARSGDFLNFNNSLKNYGMSRLHSTFMYNQSSSYARDIYNYLRYRFPIATTIAEFNANRDLSQSLDMPTIVGNALAAAGLSGSSNGRTAFNALYFLFMEAFAADGGTVNGLSIPSFLNNQYSANRLWGVRPSLGTNNPVFTSSTSGSFNLINNGYPNPLPTLASDSSVVLAGFGPATNPTVPDLPFGPSHERLYRLAGESTTNPVISISINDNDSMTQWYLVIPNDPIGAVSSSANRTFGSQGATVHVLNRNNVVNMIDTGGQTAYLFVSTLFRNVNATVTYSWGDELPLPPPPPPQRTINFSVAGGQGTLAAAVGSTSLTTGNTTAQGNTVTFTAAPANGYRVLSWSIDNGSLSGTSTALERGITVGDNNITVSVTFEEIPPQQRVINFSVAGGQGTLTAAVGSTSLTTGNTTAQGNTVTFSASPANGYTVASWSITGSTLSGGGTANTRSASVESENITVTVTFEPTSSQQKPQPEQRTINFAVAGGQGTLTAAVGSDNLTTGDTTAQGNTVTFTATPANGYQISEWTIAGSTLTGEATDAVRSATVEAANITINVTFAPINIPQEPTIHNITVNTLGSGTASAIPTHAVQGEAIELQANPDTGHEFVGWSVVRGGISLSSVTNCFATFTMPNTDVEILAVFGVENDDFGILQLNPSGTHTFPARELGYTTRPTQQIQVTNVGTAETGALSIGLSGAGANMFTVNNITLPNILPGQTLVFDVSPILGLGVGQYSATITVESTTVSYVVAQAIDVTFTVSSAGTGTGSPPPPPILPQQPSGGGAESFTPPHPPIRVPINNGDYFALGRNRDDNVTLELPAHLVTEIIEDDVDTTSFDLTDIQGITAVTLPRNAVRRLADEGIKIELVLPQGSVIFDAEAVASLGEQAIGRDITISLNARTILPNETMYRITVSSGARDIPTLDGTIAITVPYQDETPQSAWMITEDGDLIPIRFTVNDNYTITFTIQEFGTFIVSSEAGEDVEIPTIGIRLVVGSSVININDEDHINDVHPFVDTDYNRLMLPLRAIAEALGFTVEWNEDARTATITREDTDTIILSADAILPDGMGMPVIRNDRILLPLQFMSQLLEIEIHWDYENITIYIS